MSTRTDMHHGRQGGRFLPDDYVSPLDLAPDCEVCHLPMTVGQYRRHHLCNPSTIVGITACTCPPGCTDVHVGDAGTCDPSCEPCRLMRGAVHADVVEWRKTAPKDAATDVDAPLQLTLEVAS